MAASNEVWQTIRQLAQLFEARFPTKARLRILADELSHQLPQTRELTQRDAEYVLFSMEELVTLIQAASKTDTSDSQRSETRK